MTYKEFVKLPEWERRTIILKTFSSSLNDALKGTGDNFVELHDKFVQLVNKTVSSNDHKQVAKLFNQIHQYIQDIKSMEEK